MILAAAINDAHYTPLAVLLFVIFAVLAAGGGFWIAASHKGQRAGWLTASSILVVFIALFVWMTWLLQTGGLV